MATRQDIRNAARAKVAARPSRPSMQRMQSIRSAATKKASKPKVVGKKSAMAKVAARPSRPSMQRMQAIRAATKKKSTPVTSKPNKSAFKKPTRHRSASGSAARGLIAGRHTPSNNRYKTGWWRPVRQSWMSQEVWDAYKAINRFRNKMMSKGLKKASMGKQIYGKEGPGHAGYGTGKLQQWADKILRKGDGTDPHMVDLTKWFAGVAAALDYHQGDRNFDKLIKEQKKDPDHFMRYVIEKMQDYVPELRRLSKRGMTELMRNKYYTAQYGPDGRAK